MHFHFINGGFSLCTASWHHPPQYVFVLISLKSFRDDCYHTILKEAIDGNTTRHRATAEYLRSVGAREHSLHGAVQEGSIALIQDILLAHPLTVNRPLSDTFRQDPFMCSILK